jgi:hypothetical protein
MARVIIEGFNETKDADEFLGVVFGSHVVVPNLNKSFYVAQQNPVSYDGDIIVRVETVKHGSE